MKHLNYYLFRVLRRVLEDKTLPLVRRLWCRMEVLGIYVAIVPGFLGCNINFRAGGSGRFHLLP